MEYATRHLYFLYTVYTRAFLGECAYEENTSDKWHVPRYPMRKHCITTLSISKTSESLQKCSKEFGNLQSSENFGGTLNFVHNRL